MFFKEHFKDIVVLFFIVCYNRLGESMKIAIDKKSVSAIEPNNEYIYLFDKEPLDDLLRLKIHCLQYKHCEYVDINLTEYEIPCIKKASIKDKDYNKLPAKKDYKFAIIVPNFNNDRGNYQGKTFFQNCIESVLNQTYKNFDLIIVDDCSTDTSVKTVESYKDDRIHLIKNRRKRYNGGSRNVGIEYALDNLDFDYFCFLDSDDWWKHKGVLNHINARLYNHELMTIGVEMINFSGVSCRNFHRITEYKDLYSLNNKLWCTAWARVIRKDKIVYFCEDTLMEDRVWTYKLADGLNFDNVICLGEICYCWNRMNVDNSVSLSRSDFWNASAYCHIGHQLQFISQMKHTEMIPILKNRVAECESRIRKGIYQQY